jgi:hypothetical protein
MCGDRDLLTGPMFGRVAHDRVPGGVEPARPAKTYSPQRAGRWPDGSEGNSSRASDVSRKL